MKLNLLATSIVFVLSALLAQAGESPFQTREPLPWNLLENGGFERDGAGLFAVGLSERDRENPASGDASGRIEIPAGKTTLLLRISNGLRLEKDKNYLIAGRMRTALASPGAEANIQTELINKTGGLLRADSPLKLSGTTPWCTFSLRLRGDGLTALRFSLEVKGVAGERVWLDDLYVGPAQVDLSWQAAPGIGLLQAAIADGMQFEFPIPPQSHVMGVFRNGKRLLETKECEILYGAQVVRLFETPAKGEHISVVLRSVTGKAQVPALPLHHYTIFSKAGTTGAWLSEAIADFKAPNVDYAELERETIELPSVEGLPTEWSADSPRAIELKAQAPGRYSLRLRDAKNNIVAHLAEFVPLATGMALQAQFKGCDDSGAPLPPGNYVWDVLHRPLNAFAQIESYPVNPFVRQIWRSKEGWMMLSRQTVRGRLAYVVSSADEKFIEGEQKAIFTTNNLDAFVEAQPGVYFYADPETAEVYKVENGTPRVFYKYTMKTRTSNPVLAPYDTPEGPGLFVGTHERWADGRGNPYLDSEVVKLNAKGEKVAAFAPPPANDLGKPRVGPPAQLLPLEDGGVLVAEGTALSRMKADGSVGRFPSPIEASEEAYSIQLAQGYTPKAGERYRSASALARTPSGEILIAPNEEGGAAREVQMYSARGDFIAAIGRGPMQTFPLNTPGYTRHWSTQRRSFANISSIAFDPRGDLFLLDRGAGQVQRWMIAPRVSNQSLTIKTEARKEPPATRSFDPLPDSLSLETLKQRHGLKFRVVDFADLSLPATGNRLRDDGASSVIRKPGLRPYRVSGAEHFSWFRVHLESGFSNRPHLLIVEVPDDVQRRSMLAFRDEYGRESASRIELDAGYSNGGAFGLSGKERYFTALIYPRGQFTSIEFLNFLQDGAQEPLNALSGAAASRVWLLSGEEPLPENPVEEPLAGVKRSIGEHRSSVDAFVEAGRGTRGNPEAKLAGVMQSHQSRSTALNAWLGFNALDQVARDGSSTLLYPSQIFKGSNKALETTTALTLFALKESRTPVFFTFRGLGGVPADRPDLKDFGLVSEYGHASGSQLSVVYPEVQQYFRELILEFVQQFKDTPHFAGVTLQMDPHSPPLFGIPGSLLAGFEPASLKAFESASKRVIQGDTLDEHVASLKSTLREDWSVWRCGVVRDWVLSVRDELKKIRPDLRLRLTFSDADGDLRFYGFDRALYKDLENIVVFAAPRESETLFTAVGDAREIWKDLKADATTEILEINQGLGREGLSLRGSAASLLVPNKEYIPGPLVAAFVRKNPREILLQSWRRPSIGCELELREFVRAFRSLPYAPAEELAGTGALKVYRYGGKGAVQYLAVVNPTDGDVRATVTVADGPAVTTARDLVGGKDIGAKPGAGGVAFEAVVPAGNLRTFRIGK